MTSTSFVASMLSMPACAATTGYGRHPVTTAGAWTGAVGSCQPRLGPGRIVDRREIEGLAELPGLLAGVLWTGTATLHPGLLVRGLRRVAIERGVDIYENSPMVRLDRRSPPAVHTATGSVTAARAVLTLNAWSTALPELRSAILVIASDDAVTAPMPELLERCRYSAGPLVTDSQTFVTGFRTTHDHRLNAGVTGGRIGFSGLNGRRFEGRSPREADIGRCLVRAAPALPRRRSSTAGAARSTARAVDCRCSGPCRLVQTFSTATAFPATAWRRRPWRTDPGVPGARRAGRMVELRACAPAGTVAAARTVQISGRVGRAGRGPRKDRLAYENRSPVR
jgi:hypothetical protein